MIPHSVQKSSGDNEAGLNQADIGNKVSAEDVEKSLQNLRNQL